MLPWEQLSQTPCWRISWLIEHTTTTNKAVDWLNSDLKWYRITNTYFGLGRKIRNYELMSIKRLPISTVLWPYTPLDFRWPFVINALRLVVVGFIPGSTVKRFLDTLTASQSFVLATWSPGDERLPRTLVFFACSINDLSSSTDLKMLMTSRQVAGLCVASCPTEGAVNLWGNKTFHKEERCGVRGLK